VRRIFPPTGFDPRDVQHAASRHTEWDIPTPVRTINESNHVRQLVADYRQTVPIVNSTSSSSSPRTFKVWVQWGLCVWTSKHCFVSPGHRVLSDETGRSSSIIGARFLICVGIWWCIQQCRVLVTDCKPGTAFLLFSSQKIQAQKLKIQWWLLMPLPINDSLIVETILLFHEHDVTKLSNYNTNPAKWYPDSWFQTFAVFWMLYAFFWVIPHLHRPMKMEERECSETSVYKIHTTVNYPEESKQRYPNYQYKNYEVIKLI
jgi:hypothetical protein